MFVIHQCCSFCRYARYDDYSDRRAASTASRKRHLYTEDRNRSISSQRSSSVVSLSGGSLDSYDSNRFSSSSDSYSERHDGRKYQSRKRLRHCYDDRGNFSSRKSNRSRSSSRSVDRTSRSSRSNSADRCDAYEKSSNNLSTQGKHDLQRVGSTTASKIRDPWFSDLPLEWWERDDKCKAAKSRHMDKIDAMFGDREQLVLETTLWRESTVLEKNMFPYDTPEGIEHYTLWSLKDMTHEEIVSFVDGWLRVYMPHVRRWQYDDNSGERSILLFHVHVFIETIPFSFTPREGKEYFPPHVDKTD